MTVDQIARLRHRLTIMRPVRSGDEGGGATVVWTALASVWGQVSARSGREIVQGDTSSARGSFRIVMRYRNDVDATMRLNLGARVFEILAVRDEDGTKRWLTCECEEHGL